MYSLTKPQIVLISEHEGTLWNKAGISVGWQPKGNGLREVRTRNKVGRVTLRGKDAHLRIDIHPKVDGSLTGMLKQVLGAEELTDRGTREDASASHHPSAWLMRVYVRLLDVFLTRIRARGVEQEEALPGRVRGRLMASAYYKRNAYTRRHVFPCRFTEWTPDNLPNQVLRYALDVCRRYLQRHGFMGELGETGILSALVRCEAALAHVTPARIRLSDYARVRPMLRGSFQPYQRITRLAFSIIAQEDPLDFKGPLQSEIPFLDLIESDQNDDGACEWSLIDMPSLFEQYVQVVLGREKGYYCIKREERDRTIQPDLLPLNTPGGLVMDAKYKRWGTDVGGVVAQHRDPSTLAIREQQKLDFSDPKPEDVDNQQKENNDENGSNWSKYEVPNNDLYQLISYSSHEKIRASSAALVYPCSAADEIPKHPKLVADRFGTGFNEDDPLKVYVLFAPLAKAAVGGEKLLEQVDQLQQDIRSLT